MFQVTGQAFYLCVQSQQKRKKLIPLMLTLKAVYWSSVLTVIFKHVLVSVGKRDFNKKFKNMNIHHFLLV